MEEGNKMKCPNCNNDTNNNDKFCKYCGSNLKKEILDEEKCLEAYVGIKYEKFKSSNFNVGAFFLGPIYLLYRKMYIYAFIFIVLFLLAFFWLPLVINIILADLL